MFHLSVIEWIAIAFNLPFALTIFVVAYFEYKATNKDWEETVKWYKDRGIDVESGTYNYERMYKFYTDEN